MIIGVREMCNGCNGVSLGDHGDHACSVAAFKRSLTCVDKLIVLIEVY